jgi:hypothetical protein
LHLPIEPAALVLGWLASRTVRFGETIEERLTKELDMLKQLRIKLSGTSAASSAEDDEPEWD